MRPAQGDGRGYSLSSARTGKSMRGLEGSNGQIPIHAWQRSTADDPEIKNAFYGAPSVITLFAPKGFLFAVDDCAVAAENMMLAAASLEIGSCYIGQGWTAFADPYGQEILKTWGIRTDYYAVMQLLLGYQKEGDRHPSPKPRKAGRVLRF